MEKCYQFAGVNITVDIPDEKMYPNDRALTAFRSEEAKRAHRFTFEFVDSLQPPKGDLAAQVPEFRLYRENDWSVRYVGSTAQTWEGAYMRAAHRDREHSVQLLASRFPGAVGVKTVLGALSAEHLIARNGGYLFHCSYIEHEGEAILFTAPSGTGKSTQADLWHSHRDARIINGDRAAVRVVDGVPYACGIPFAGSSSYCENVTLPLKAIVYLAQAPETTIRRLRGYQAFRRVWEGCSVNTWDPEDMQLVSDAVSRTVAAVPVFYLPCTPDRSAVIALEQALKE